MHTVSLLAGAFDEIYEPQGVKESSCFQVLFEEFCEILLQVFDGLFDMTILDLILQDCSLLEMDRTVWFEFLLVFFDHKISHFRSKETLTPL